MFKYLFHWLSSMKRSLCPSLLQLFELNTNNYEETAGNKRVNLPVSTVTYYLLRYSFDKKYIKINLKRRGVSNILSI